MSKQSSYMEMVERNIGLLNTDEQQLLRETSVPVFGVGGLGGVVAELLVRSGIGKLKIVDIDNFEASNLNRQIYAYQSTLGKHKVDVAAKFLKDINPELELETYYETTDETIAKMLADSTIAMMCIDKVIPSIHVARRCHEKNISMLETVAIPYINTRIYNQDTISFEDFHCFPTTDKTINELYTLTDQEMAEIGACFVGAFAGLEGITSLYSEEAMTNMKKGYFSSFAPFVWMQSVMLTLEAIKLLLGWGKPSLAPDYNVFDPVNLRVLPPTNINLNKMKA